MGVVADPQFSMARGLCNAPFSLSITDATAGAQIHFTTDGSTPSAVSGTLYTGPITITNTTVLSAIATEPGYLPSSVVTCTYVFLTNVITQSLRSATNAGFPASGRAQRRITTWIPQSPALMRPKWSRHFNRCRRFSSRQRFPTCLTRRPAFTRTRRSTASLGNARLPWKWWTPTARREFQVGCGLRIQGGAFRDFGYTQKKSLRVLFKSQYGAGKLHYDLFKDPTAVQDFDGLVLRAGANDGYAWGDAGHHRSIHPGRVWPAPAAGHGPSLRARDVRPRLFEWALLGLYNLTERPNEDFLRLLPGWQTQRTGTHSPPAATPKTAT